MELFNSVSVACRRLDSETMELFNSAHVACRRLDSVDKLVAKTESIVVLLKISDIFKK